MPGLRRFKMIQLTKTTLEEFEIFCRQDNPKASEEEIKSYLLKYGVLYTKKEVDDYLKSQERKTAFNL